MKSAELKKAVGSLSKKIDVVIAAVAAKPRANLTQAAFARLANLSRATVHRKVKRGDLRTAVDGRILFSELSKYTS